MTRNKILLTMCGMGIGACSQPGHVPPQRLLSPLACPEGLQSRVEVFPAGTDAWWRFGESRGEIVGLTEAWPFPAWRAMAEGDELASCMDADGRRRGPVMQALADPSGGSPTRWVRGVVDETALPHGAWSGGWDLQRQEFAAFDGTYDHGVRAGAWRFYAPELMGAEPVASGRFERGRAHGPWSFRTGEKTLESRYIYGNLHGAWRERFNDGREVKGSYFNGTRNYEWDFYNYEAGTGRLLSRTREAWKYDTFVARWDYLHDPNPLPGKDVPYTHLGPNAEGICEVHARCASNSFLTTMLAGDAVDADGVYDYPILVDYADRSAPPPPRDRFLIVNSYTIEEVKVTEDEHSARSRILLERRCRVDLGSRTIEPLSRWIKIHLDLRDEDGTWKLLRPPPENYVRFDAFLLITRQRDAAFAERLLTECVPLD